MTGKDMGARRCAYCDTPFAKKTETRFPERGQALRTRADVEAISNMPIVSVRYTYDREWDEDGNRVNDPTTKRVYSWNVWDGESYVSGYGPFCKLVCAERFGRSAYLAGYRIKRPRT